MAWGPRAAEAPSTAVTSRDKCGHQCVSPPPAWQVGARPSSHSLGCDKPPQKAPELDTEEAGPLSRGSGQGQGEFHRRQARACRQETAAL